MLLAQRIHERRLSAGLSMGQLATYAKVSPGYISQLEGALIESPGTKRLERIASQLGCSIDDLLGREQPESDPRIDTLIHQIGQLSDAGKDQVFNFVRFALENEQNHWTAEQREQFRRLDTDEEQTS